MGYKSKVFTRRETLKYALYSTAAASLAPALWISGCGERRGYKPNVVVILIDTLRPDYLGFYGYKKETATFLAKVAENSAVFLRAFATSSWTAPSTASLFTSKYPHQHTVIEGFFANKLRIEELRREGKAGLSLNRLPKDLPTLPEIFKSMGYATFGMATNINIGGEIGFNRGFDRFERLSGAPASVIYERMFEWKERITKSKPFFLYLHPNDVHSPYNKRQPYYEKQDDPREERRARYHSEIGYVDAYLGKIYEMLNLAENTIFVVVSDHGEEFWEHGSIGHDAKMYRELTQILLIFHSPLLKLKPQRIDVNVSLVDVLPTLVDLVSYKSLQRAEGVSLAPLLKTGALAKTLIKQLRNRPLFAHRIVDAISSPRSHWSETMTERQLWAVIYQHWNLIERYDSQNELFDHRYDLEEKYNVILKHPELTSQLLTRLKKFKNRGQRKDAEKVPVELDENLLETLKSLGYVE